MFGLNPRGPEAGPSPSRYGTAVLRHFQPRKSRSFLPSPEPALSRCAQQPPTSPISGSWRIESLTMPMSGRWRVRVEILIDDFERFSIDDEIDFLN